MPFFYMVVNDFRMNTNGTGLITFPIIVDFNNTFSHVQNANYDKKKKFKHKILSS